MNYVKTQLRCAKLSALLVGDEPSRDMFGWHVAMNKKFCVDEGWSGGSGLRSSLAYILESQGEGQRVEVLE